MPIISLTGIKRVTFSINKSPKIKQNKINHSLQGVIQSHLIDTLQKETYHPFLSKVTLGCEYNDMDFCCKKVLNFRFASYLFETSVMFI